MRNSAIDHDAVKQASSILQRILTEEPDFWPYGLSVDQFDGGLYMLSKSANSNEYIGFVGWQEREDEGRNIGYYAIGVLPEYRRQGLAKAAVQKLLREKSAGVDEVRALVMSHNAPSQKLARSIPGVKLTIMEKLASIDKSAQITGKQLNMLKHVLAPTLGAFTAHTTYDQLADPENRTLESTFRPDTWGDDKKRKLLAAFNMLAGAGIGWGAANKNAPAAIAGFMGLPLKDVALKGLGLMDNVDLLAKATRSAIARPKEGVPKNVLYGMLGLGAGALGLGAYASLQKARAASAQADAARGGRVKVTLPTKDPNDAETLLDIPIEEMNLSNALKARLSRDTRRKLYEETRKRTKRRRPQNPMAPTDKEQEDMQLQQEEQELDKVAAAGPQPSVPSPPGAGNPALRQTQQQAAANSIDTSTAANPQIMKAQQEAADASMQAQQQVAQVEQQTQQQLMDQQQGFQQEFQKSEQEKQQVLQENQILKLQLEKAKIEADVAQAKMQAEKELLETQGSIGDGKNDQLNQLIGSRLERVSQNITKEGTAGPWGIEVDTKRRPAPVGTIDALTGKRVGGSEINSVTGKPLSPKPKMLDDNTAQTINDNGLEYMASGRLPGIHLFRASYGRLGDTLFDYLARPYLYQPPKQTPGLLGGFRQSGMEMLMQPRF